MRSPDLNGLFYGIWINMEVSQRFGMRESIVLAVFSHDIYKHIGRRANR